ncbi:hypothetical protein EDB80DRAFT_742446 [Ilyonectria destructans]|nr:hypothetical protein EDB80DRAFT_742446 [Ilyonectria destructans]
MASTVVFKLPDDLNGTPIPSEENVDPVDMSPANLFARLFYDAKASFTAKAAAIFDRDADFPMMRFIELRSRQTKSGKVMPVVNVTRPQAADSLVKFMYGQENKGKQACQKCKDGTGAFNAYVALDEMSPGLCHLPLRWCCQTLLTCLWWQQEIPRRIL